MKKLNKYRKSFAILLMILITFVMVYFTVYETEHSYHNCNQMDCPICHVLHMAQSITKNICSGSLAAYAGFLYLISALIIMPYILRNMVMRNLIIDKVRLDD